MADKPANTHQWTTYLQHMQLRLLGELVQVLRHGADAVVGHEGEPLAATLQLRQGLRRAGYKVAQRIPDDTCKQAQSVSTLDHMP